jgi:hypothetical protein
MSSNKMEQSLDDILKANKPTRGRGRSSRRSGAGRPATAAAPVGGVSKSTRQGKQTKAAPTAPAAILSGETKIMVSNLVSRSQYKILGTFTGNQALLFISMHANFANAYQPKDVDQVQLQVCKTDAGL